MAVSYTHLPMESPAFVDAVDRKYNLAEIKNLSGGKGYFLFLQKRMTDDVFIANEEIPSAVFEPIRPKEEISSLAETKICLLYTSILSFSPS